MARPKRWRTILVPPVIASLVAGIAGGLVRAGVGLPAGAGEWIGPAVGAHAFLMLCTFLGTVIGIERAVALRHPLAFAGPVASALAAAAVLAGAHGAAAWLVAGASLAFVGVGVAIVRRQPAEHTGLLVVAALAWAAGSVLHALGAAGGAVVPLWFAFVVLTIAAERLEMARLARRREFAAPSLRTICAALLAGAALSAAPGPWGGALFGAALGALALWLATFDVARHTVRAPGLPRYMAVCLLLGYAWLLVAGIAWAATSSGLPLRDAALHGLAIGFVLGMVFAHAPVVLPAIAGVKVRFGAAYYLPLVLLHGSLALRVVGGPGDPAALAAGAAGNALAVAAFAATVAGSAVAWRRTPSPRIERSSDGIASPR